MPWEEHSFIRFRAPQRPRQSVTVKTKSNIGYETVDFEQEGYRVYVIADLSNFTGKSPLTQFVDLKRWGVTDYQTYGLPDVQF